MILGGGIECWTGLRWRYDMDLQVPGPVLSEGAQLSLICPSPRKVAGAQHPRRANNSLLQRLNEP